MKEERVEKYYWIQRCQLTGETLGVYLTEQEKVEIENQPGFKGWDLDNFFEIED